MLIQQPFQSMRIRLDVGSKIDTARPSSLIASFEARPKSDGHLRNFDRFACGRRPTASA